MEESEEEYFKTQEARRLTRKKLRDVLDTLQAQRLDLSEIRNSDLFRQILSQVEHMFHTEVGANVRELKFDALVMKELADLLKAQAVKLDDVSKRCDFETFSQKLKVHMSRQQNNVERIQWALVGNYSLGLRSTVPSYTAMLGPIEKEEKKRKVAERRQIEDLRNVATEKAETVENQKEDDDEATNQRVVNLYNHISKLKNKNFDVLDMLIDPKDPVQTVENFFDFSFLIKTKSVAVDIDKNLKTAIGTPVDPNKVANTADKQQMVLSISMKDLMRLQQLEKDEHHENPLHRDDVIYHAKDAKEQVQIIEKQSKRSKDDDEEAESDRVTSKKRRGK